MTRVFLDANVLVAASIKNGPARRFMRRARQRKSATLITNEYGLDEAERNVQHWKPDCFESFRTLRQQVRTWADPTEQMEKLVSSQLPKGKRLPKKDLPILAGAVTADADWLVTRDSKDFRPLYGERVFGVEILSLGAGLKRL